MSINYIFGDTPTFTFTLHDDSGNPAQLFGASVVLVLRDAGASVALGTFACTVVGNGSTGQVSYHVTGAETTYPGGFLSSLVVTYADATIETFPSPADDGTPTYQSWTILPGLTSIYAPTAAGFTLTDLLASVRRRLQVRPDKQNLVHGAIDANPGSTTLIAKYPIANINIGSVLSIGQETMYVWEQTADARTLVVQRGYAGSKLLAHPDGELIYVDPVFTNYDLFVEVNKELAALPAAGLYRVSTFDFTVTSALVGYPLPADLIEGALLDLSWLELSNRLYRPDDTSYRVELNVPKAEFATGNALYLYHRPTIGQPVRATYKAALNPLVFGSDLVASTTGLPGSAIDVLEMGAAIRAFAGRPMARADFTRQGDTRRAAEATTTDVSNAPTALRQNYARRLAEEVGQLTSNYAARLPRRSLR